MKTIKYKGVIIEVRAQSIRFGVGHCISRVCFKRPVEDTDIDNVKEAIDVGRASMTAETLDLINQSRGQVSDGS